MAAVAARLTEHLTDLYLMDLPAVGEPGWTALAAAYPRLGRLRSIYTNDSSGMGDAGARALAAVPMPRTLKTLSLERCGITVAGQAMLEAARARDEAQRGPATNSDGEHVRLNISTESFSMALANDDANDEDEDEDASDDDG